MARGDAARRLGSGREPPLRLHREGDLAAVVPPDPESDRPPHRDLQRRPGSNENRASDLPVPRGRSRLGRHRLQLPHRRGRHGLRGQARLRVFLGASRALHSRGYGVAGAHAQGYNSGTVGLALLGTLAVREPTPAARSAAEALVAAIVGPSGIDPTSAGPYANPVHWHARDVPQRRRPPRRGRDRLPRLGAV